SSSPNYELFRTVLGIDSAASGFNRVVIRPFLGKLTRASGSIPHPKGEVAVNLVHAGAKLEAEVRLPVGVTGELIWQGTRRPLKSGLNKMSLSDLPNNKRDDKPSIKRTTVNNAKISAG